MTHAIIEAGIIATMIAVHCAQFVPSLVRSLVPSLARTRTTR
ncbi:MAG: hypothetical protein ACXIU1_03365 [Schaalia turicensis]